MSEESLYLKLVCQLNNLGGAQNPHQRMSAEQALSRVHHAVPFDPVADEAARQVQGYLAHKKQTPP